MDKKRVLKLFVLFFVLLSLIPLAFSFQVGNISNNIETSYSPGDNVRGWVNISLSNEYSDNLISSNFPGTIKLVDLLEGNSADYTCVPEDCSINYASTNPETSESFSLNYGQEKIISLFVNGNIGGINSLSFNVSVNNAPTCTNPLRIDFFDDNSTEWKASKVTNDFSCFNGAGTGCFNVSEQTVQGEIGSQMYCEKIKLMASEKFRLGAWIKNGTTPWSSGLLEMFLYDLDNNELESCAIENPPNSTGKQVYCDITYRNEEQQDYYVCLKASEEVDYRIKKEDVNPCGFYGEPPGSSDKHDYYIFAKAAMFSNIGNFSFNQYEYESQGNGNLADDVWSYLDKYENCSNGCSIPIKFKSYGNLNIVVSNLNLRYLVGGLISSSNNFYDASKQSAKLNSGFIQLDLDSSGIKVPSSPGNYTLILYLKNEVVLSKLIEVQNATIINDIFPSVVPAGIKTKFSISAKIPSGRNISSYRWDFGDGEEEETTTNSVKHVYSEIGDYDLSLEIEDSLGYISKKTITIKVISPKDSINSTILMYKKRLENITSQISVFPEWYKNKIENILSVDDLTSEIKTLEQKYNSATSDEEYVNIMLNLSELNIPYKIKESSKNSVIFFVNVDDVNPEYFADFGAGSIEDNKNYKEAITAWSQDNLDMTLSFKYVYAYYDDNVESLVSIFNLNIKPNENLDKEIYVIIGSNNIAFSGQQDTRDFDEDVGIRFRNIEERNIEFAVLEDVPVEKLVLYLSPEFDLLDLETSVVCNANNVCESDLGENWKNCRVDCKPWGWVIVLIFILVFFALAAYIALQWWYKEKYERYLFKNRNDLYNLMNFISNARSQGLQDKEIIGKLKASGWGGEQINYVFKKMAGKAIMPFDFLRLFKKTDKMAMKNPQPPGRPLGNFIIRR